jgi:uncharacterized protein
MLVKLLVLGAVLYLVYKIFFNKKIKDGSKSTKDEIDTMEQCPSCKVFIAREDSILSNGKYYCSKECLDK